MFPLDEYNALRTGFGIVDLAGWSSVSLAGADRQTFLNNFCTNDVKRLTPGTNCEAFITNVKGKMLGHVLVTCREEELVLVTVPGQAATLVEHLDRYLIREDVRLQDTTAERAYLLVAGGRPASELLSRWAPALGAGEAVGREGNLAAEVAGVPVRLIAWDWLTVPCAYLLESSPDDMARLQEILADEGAVACDETAFTAVRIESGLPLFGIDFGEENLPQEVDRDTRAISFTKGCYLGQETVARIDALGHVNRYLAGVRFSGTDVPPAGAELTDAGATVGRVSSATYSPRLGAPLAWAMIRRGSNEPGSQLDSPLGTCEVVELPVGDS